MLKKRLFYSLCNYIKKNLLDCYTDNMSSSRLHRPDNPLNVREKKNERNRKKREKFAALSVEQKEAHRRKNRDAYHRRKLTKLLSKPLAEQSQQISKPSDTSGSVIPATSNNCADGTYPVHNFRFLIYP